MSILEMTTEGLAPATANDEAEIAALHIAFEAQRRAFATDRNPSLDERRNRIETLMAMMAANRERISAAMNADFGIHPAPASDLLEVLSVLGRARYVLDHLEEWMRPSPRDVDSGLFGSASAYAQSQPKGIIGNMIPWNFPFDIGVGPVIEMLAAGNRVILKPSEYAPACAALLREMIAAAFDPALVYVAVGGTALARAFAALPWDHLLYTGSPNVGREIMAAAARNLTPVTLELGGKCPALLTTGSITPRNVEAVIGTKAIKNGQMCISVDYCMVPGEELETFIHLAEHYAGSVAEHAGNSDRTGIISERHFDRLESMLQEARDRGSRIMQLGTGHADRAERSMPMVLVIDPPPDLRIMQEEIFGPILPVISYDDLDAALDTINAGERPLGLYVFGEDQPLIDHVLATTISGGAVVNGCALQGALPSLGFGGVGMSGMGRHHGIDGFREFSNRRGIVVRGTDDMIDAFFPPYNKARQLVTAAFPPS